VLNSPKKALVLVFVVVFSLIALEISVRADDSVSDKSTVTIFDKDSINFTNSSKYHSKAEQLVQCDSSI